MTDKSHEPGASPRGWIPLGVPCLRGNEWKYVKECLDTNWVSSVGPFVERFEALTAARLGARHAVATVNGTSALHTALLVAGVGKDDEVVVSDLTFIAPANAIRYVGAWPVFVDAEPEHWQIDPGKLASFLERECAASPNGLRNRHTGRIVRAIMPVHILGHPCAMKAVMELAERYGLVVIEDASEALGARYGDRAVGHLAHMACLSFNGNKIMTTGGGGMLLTDDERWAARARYFTTQAKDDPKEFVHEAVGYNYRLTNVLAAMGCAQLEQLDDFVGDKRRTAAAYTRAFAGEAAIATPREAEGAVSTFWLYTILVDERACAVDSRELIERLAAGRIQARSLWQPMHRSPAHRGAWSTDCSVADGLNRRGVSLPCSVGISERDIETVVGAVRRAVAGER